MIKKLYDYLRLNVSISCQFKYNIMLKLQTVLFLDFLCFYLEHTFAEGLFFFLDMLHRDVIATKHEGTF